MSSHLLDSYGDLPNYKARAKVAANAQALLEGSTISLPDTLGGLQIKFFLIQEPLSPPLLNKKGSFIRIFNGGGLVLERSLLLVCVRYIDNIYMYVPIRI